ncbi:AroM family protein [Sporosarcina soli]|uniref:AroM family protein n=1 Tax=Sporosarcina soli TaxID=334736 RepID=A0ABW0TRJ0_9BACL
MKKSNIGVITIGQSPRIDLVPEMEKVIGNQFSLIEAGALDDLSSSEILELYPDKGETTYVSRLRDGSYATMGKSKVEPLLQEKIDQLSSRVEVIIILCTGTFEKLSCDKPIIYPDKILDGVVRSLFNNQKIGIVIPIEDQKQSMLEKWHGCNVCVIASNPYTEMDIGDAVASLKSEDVQCVVLDCMGYNEKHKQQAISTLGVPVLLPRTLVARVAMEVC